MPCDALASLLYKSFQFALTIYYVAPTARLVIIATCVIAFAQNNIPNKVVGFMSSVEALDIERIAKVFSSLILHSFYPAGIGVQSQCCFSL